MPGSRKYLLWMLLASLGGAGAVVCATSVFGPGTSPDSATYLDGASNILGGHGYCRTLPDGSFRAITHWPPFYSMLISAVTPLAGTPLAAVRAIAVFLFALNIILAALMLRSYCRPTILIALAAFALAFSYDLVRLHSMALSEVPFFTLMLISLWLAARHLDSQKLTPLFLAAVAASLAMITRYPGAAIISAVFLVVLFRGPATPLTRLRNSLIFASVSIVPFVALLIRNRIAGASATNRGFAFHPIDFSYIYSAATSISEWLLPSTSPIALRVAGLVFLTVVAVWMSAFLWHNRHTVVPHRPLAFLPHLLIVFMLSYTLVYVLTISFFDSYIVEKLSYRAMSPLFLAGFLLLIMAMQQTLDLRPTARLMRGIFLLLLLCFVAVQFVQSAIWVLQSHRDGIGLAARKWRDCDLITAIRNMPIDTPMITNAADLVYLQTGRSCYRIPPIIESVSLLPNKEYAAQISQLHTLLVDKRGVLIYFSNYGQFAFMPSNADLEASLGLVHGQEYTEGTIYTAHP
jgi:hypothetical protein